MIKILEKQVADKIAAGEVVDRPLSVVKELVENSIDSGATSIVCEIRKGGKAYIRVSDNGCGIAEEETELAFFRHATSKISQAEDLDRIETLGFRGEALSSIAAVSRVELLTKVPEAFVGTKLTIHGGEVINHIPYGCPDGTTVVINDLFYNTPARLKFMKADNTESALVTDFISQIALAYPYIRVRMINNGNILFSTLGNGSLYDTILTVYSKSVGQDLVEVDYRDEYLTVKGYVSAPMNSKTSRRNQIFFVNGRVISSKIIERGVNNAYADRLFEGRFPICFLFLSVSPDKLDVNIHPNKREVRFHQEDFITEGIFKAIRNALGTKTAINQIHSENISDKINIITDSIKEEGISRSFTPVTKAQESANTAFSSRTFTFENKVLDKEPDMLRDSVENNQKNIKVPAKQEQVDITSLLSTLRNADGNFNITAPKNVPFKFEDLKPMGSVFATYILAADSDSFYMIDQHAAHERVFFEKLLAEFKSSEKHIQPSLVPAIINVRPAIEACEEQWLEILRGMGFDIFGFGPQTYNLSAVPMFMSLKEGEDFVNDFLDNLDENMDFSNYGKLNAIITRSCKSAVKGNDQLHDEEIKALLHQLSKCENPYSCPHGRPTFVRFSKYELEKFFKRIQ